MKEELREIYWKMLQARLNKIKMFFHKIYRMFNIKYLLDLKNSQDNIQKFFHFLSENIKIYKKSLEELVEGHREVTYNKDFKFQNGQTVQNKIDKVNELMTQFDRKIKETLSIDKLAQLKDELKGSNEKKLQEIKTVIIAI